MGETLGLRYTKLLLSTSALQMQSAIHALDVKRREVRAGLIAWARGWQTSPKQTAQKRRQ